MVPKILIGLAVLAFLFGGFMAKGSIDRADHRASTMERLDEDQRKLEAMVARRDELSESELSEMRSLRMDVELATSSAGNQARLIRDGWIYAVASFGAGAVLLVVGLVLNRKKKAAS